MLPHPQREVPGRTRRKERVRSTKALAAPVRDRRRPALKRGGGTPKN